MISRYCRVGFFTFIQSSLNSNKIKEDMSEHLSHYKKRLVITILILTAGLWHLIISFTNLTDYGTNFEFVRHVLSMDTIFPNSKVAYRSLPQSWIHHVCYWMIIILESTIAILLLVAGYRMNQNLKANGIDFENAKSKAYVGISLGMILWFLSFTVVGAEWFSMWQSTAWNATETAKSNLLIMIGIYVSLILVD